MLLTADRLDPPDFATIEAGPRPGPSLCVVIPTYNERANIAVLIDRLRHALRRCAWEVILVDDDSPDGTCTEVRRFAGLDARIRCIHRIGRKGLSSACMEGILATNAEFVAVMDADLQHDETVLPAMLHAVQFERADIAIGSRYRADGSASGGFDRSRQHLSDAGSMLARAMLTQDVSDPMSGFFLVRRAEAERLAPHLSLEGFKLLFDILLASPPDLAIAEVGYDFAPRLRGQSKLSPQTMLAFLSLLAERCTGRLIPARFFPFCAMGALGLLIHLLIVALAQDSWGVSFPGAQAVATWTAMSLNFVLNNRITFADQRLRGLAAAKGFAAWIGICSIGALANVGIAASLYDDRYPVTLAAIAGAVITAAWNFAVSARLVWRRA